ncbi:hypothetical protein NQ318_012623 [Aromia moschata]|uniref:Transposase n=1 Tax=Aromia moschata TaxID=1265417 RepID=A0AAV8XG56_9CUCU|nr:hypothetical protein NQ318_012623 [Aromia moschata]
MIGLTDKPSDDQKLDVKLMLEENPHTSSRQTASALNINHSSILRVLTENQMHPYKLVPTNEIVEDDFDRRILFCEQMMQIIDDNTLQIENVLFSDESTFTLHGPVSRQNCRYWSRENPQWMWELHTQTPQKVNVWAGIIGENIIGPFFIDGNLNGETYLALLQNNIVPTMANLYPAEGNPQLPELVHSRTSVASYESRPKSSANFQLMLVIKNFPSNEEKMYSRHEGILADFRPASTTPQLGENKVLTPPSRKFTSQERAPHMPEDPPSHNS